MSGGPACHRFGRSARLDPQNLEAVREVRVFEMRSSHGSMKRLFGV